MTCSFDRDRSRECSSSRSRRRVDSHMLRRGRDRARRAERPRAVKRPSFGWGSPDRTPGKIDKPLRLPPFGGEIETKKARSVVALSRVPRLAGFAGSLRLPVFLERLTGLLSGSPPTDTRPQARAKMGKVRNTRLRLYYKRFLPCRRTFPRGLGLREGRDAAQPPCGRRESPLARRRPHSPVSVSCLTSPAALLLRAWPPVRSLRPPKLSLRRVSLSTT